jgi:hypothetical protein
MLKNDIIEADNKASLDGMTQTQRQLSDHQVGRAIRF